MRFRPVALALVMSAVAACSTSGTEETVRAGAATAGFTVRTLPLPADVKVESATFTPSGAVLVEFAADDSGDKRHINLATLADDGSGFRQFFSGRIPDRPLDNGLRQMVFPDNRRIFLGDFVIECAARLEACVDPALVPVEYPAEVADGSHIAHRWSEIVVTHDDRIAWTTLLADFSAVLLTGQLVRKADTYVVTDPRIVSTIVLTVPDPDHPDGVLPVDIRGGEVKQFVDGGTALSLAGMTGHDIPDSVVYQLGTEQMEAITSTPGYTETTIFSPDEQLGLVMSTRFSAKTDPAVLGLLPRPYPDSLKMNLSMLAYTYAVTGVRRTRKGNIGPALIDIERSKSKPGYLGYDLNTSPDWVYRSPMSWHPDSTKGMWIEGHREAKGNRVQIVELLDRRPTQGKPARPWPDAIPGSSGDLSIIPSLAQRDENLDLKVYGKASGHILYRRKGGLIEKTYVDFSDDGRHVYRGFERMDANPRATSTYTAAIDLVGKVAGAMHLTITFGPLGGDMPAMLIFAEDAEGRPASTGYAEYGGKRLSVSDLVP